MTTESIKQIPHETALSAREQQDETGERAMFPYHVPPSWYETYWYDGLRKAGFPEQ